MRKLPKPITILMADDDPDDRQLTKEAFEENHLANDLRFVEDGEELLDYLYQRGKYAAEGAAPLPAACGGRQSAVPEPEGFNLAAIRMTDDESRMTNYLTGW